MNRDDWMLNANAIYLFSIKTFIILLLHKNVKIFIKQEQKNGFEQTFLV